MNEDRFLSNRVRDAYFRLEEERNNRIEDIMRREGLGRDAAELSFYRAVGAERKKMLQNALNTTEFFTKIRERMDMDFEGAVVDFDLAVNIRYAHFKAAMVDGVRVTMWAENNEQEAYVCDSPENVVGYKVSIKNYDDHTHGISFFIKKDEIWTKEKIMQEFDEIIEQVKKRVDFSIFKTLYGNLTNVSWGS